MRPDNEAKLVKVKKISRGLKAACKGAMWLVVLQLGMAAIALLVNRGGSVGYFDEWFRVEELTLRSRMLVLAMSAVASGIMFLGLYQLQQLFGNYSRGEIFTRESVGTLRRLGVTCVLWGVAKVFWGGLWHLLSPHAPHSFQVSADAIPIGVIILVVAWFLDMAVEMREESELTV
jgi:hypothetical protein